MKPIRVVGPKGAAMIYRTIDPKRGFRIESKNELWYADSLDVAMNRAKRIVGQQRSNPRHANPFSWEIRRGGKPVRKGSEYLAEKAAGIDAKTALRQLLAENDEAISGIKDVYKKKSGRKALVGFQSPYGVKASILRRNPRRRRNPYDHKVTELTLYLENDSPTYFQHILPTQARLRADYERGEYSKQKAIAAWRKVVDFAATRLSREMGTYSPERVRQIVAQNLEEYYNPATYVG